MSRALSLPSPILKILLQKAAHTRSKLRGRDMIGLIFFLRVPGYHGPGLI
jgi:hypothetical protein